MIYKVLKNIKHNGTYYSEGSTIDGEEGAYSQLVEDGFLCVDDGIEKEEVVESTIEKEIPPENTWGPKPDEPIAPLEEDKKEEENKDEVTGADVAAPLEEDKKEETPIIPEDENIGDNL